MFSEFHQYFLQTNSLPIFLVWGCPVETAAQGGVDLGRSLQDNFAVLRQAWKLVLLEEDDVTRWKAEELVPLEMRDGWVVGLRRRHDEYPHLFWQTLKSPQSINHH